MIDGPVVIGDQCKKGVNKYGVDKARCPVNRYPAFNVEAVKFVEAKQSKYQVKCAEYIVAQQYRAYHHYNKKKARYGACLHKLIWFNIIISIARLKSSWCM